MRRRQLLQGVTAVGTASVAGCLSGAASNVVLDPPADRQFDSEELPYPAHGQALPEFSLPNPLSGNRIAIAELDRTLLVAGSVAGWTAERVPLVGQRAGVQHGTVETAIEDR